MQDDSIIVEMVGIEKKENREEGVYGRREEGGGEEEVGWASGGGRMV